MTAPVLRIITRESPLAMWQAQYVRDRLQHFHPALDVQIIGTTTEADRFLESKLSSLGGKGAFVKELEHALLREQADIAVHSMKDVPVHLPDGLQIGAILQREDPGDAFVSNHHARLADLPAGAIIGTSSLRRRCQLQALRPDLVIRDIRGNVGSRLNKLDTGAFDALVLACSGLSRLGLADRIRERIAHEVMLPAIGQGALGIEVRVQDARTHEWIAPLNDETTRICVTAERAVNEQLDGGCHAPVAAYATRNAGQLALAALVGDPDGTELIRGSLQGPDSAAERLGTELGRELLARGAARILSQLKNVAQK